MGDTIYYLLRFVSYKSTDSGFHGVYSSKHLAISEVTKNHCVDEGTKGELSAALEQTNKYYDGNGEYIIDEITLDKFYNL